MVYVDQVLIYLVTLHRVIKGISLPKVNVEQSYLVENSQLEILHQVFDPQSFDQPEEF